MRLGIVLNSGGETGNKSSADMVVVRVLWSPGAAKNASDYNTASEGFNHDLEKSTF